MTEVELKNFLKSKTVWAIALAIFLSVAEKNGLLTEWLTTYMPSAIHYTFAMDLLTNYSDVGAMLLAIWARFGSNQPLPPLTIGLSKTVVVPSTTTPTDTTTTS